jgi:hypothetical protein
MQPPPEPPAAALAPPELREPCDLAELPARLDGLRLALLAALEEARRPLPRELGALLERAAELHPRTLAELQAGDAIATFAAAAAVALAAVDDWQRRGEA